MIITIFQQFMVPNFRAHNWKIFPNLVLFTFDSLRSSFIDSFSPQRNAATLRKVLAPFSVSHVIAIDSCSLVPFISRTFSLSLFFFLFLEFIATSDCVLNNKNNHSTRVCWISNNYNLFGAMRLVGYLSC